MYSIENTVNYDFSISKLTFMGERDINIKIKTKLNNYTLIESDKNFIVEITSSAEKITIAKDAAGDATEFKNEITVDVQVFIDEEYKLGFVIVEDFIYNNNSNTIELRTYENQIKGNLAEAAVDKITLKLALYK